MSTEMRMQLFGSFCLENDKVRLDENVLHSKKLTRLLVYLIFNRDQALSQKDLQEVFWKDDSKNPSGALKNLMYRLREALKIFGDEDFVCTLPGAYQWNPDIPVRTDYEQLEELAEAVDVETDTQRIKELCQEAIRCFNGNISGRLSNEPWILSKATWYRSAYMDIVKTLGEILEGEGAWSELETLCSTALACDRLDENLHYWTLKSLVGQKKYDLALSHYEKVSRLFYGTPGLRVTERMKDIFQKALKQRGGWEVDITQLISRLDEGQRPEGVFFCDYQAFRQIYRMEARRISRSGLVEYVVLLTVRRNGGIAREPVNDSSLLEAVSILRRELGSNLRMGDVVAQYSMTQFILLLPMCGSMPDCESVMDRINKQFIKKIGTRHLELVYEMEEVYASI